MRLNKKYKFGRKATMYDTGKWHIIDQPGRESTVHNSSYVPWIPACQPNADWVRYIYSRASQTAEVEDTDLLYAIPPPDRADPRQRTSLCLACQYYILDQSHKYLLGSSTPETTLNFKVLDDIKYYFVAYEGWGDTDDMVFVSATSEEEAIEKFLEDDQANHDYYQDSNIFVYAATETEYKPVTKKITYERA